MFLVLEWDSVKSLSILEMRILAESVLVDQGMVVDVEMMLVPFLMRWMLHRFESSAFCFRLLVRIVKRAAHDVPVFDRSIEQSMCQFLRPATGKREQEADPVQDSDPEPVLLPLAEREARVGKV